jgi:hypothetical protein
MLKWEVFLETKETLLQSKPFHIKIADSPYILSQHTVSIILCTILEEHHIIQGCVLKNTPPPPPGF